MAGSLTVEKVEGLAAAVFHHPNPHVVEAYSAFGSALRSFHSPEELVAYVLAQRDSVAGAAHIAVYYPDMGGELLRPKLLLNPELCGGHSFRYGAAGWGLIWAHLPWRQSAAGSFISANSEKRARSWAPTHPELGAPEEWDWAAVGRHLRRLRRALKLAA